jgi:hypothetical protein
MVVLNPDYAFVGVRLHDALLASPATKAACATHIITTGGLSLSQAAAERAIDLIIQDMFDELILVTADYATLLARHQTADPVAALRVINASANKLLLLAEKEQTELIISTAASEWLGLSQAQRDAIPGLKAAGDAGVDAMNGRIYWIDDRLAQLAKLREQ